MCVLLIYLSFDVLGVVLVVVGLHAELQLLDEVLLRKLVYLETKTDRVNT